MTSTYTVPQVLPARRAPCLITRLAAVDVPSTGVDGPAPAVSPQLTDDPIADYFAAGQRPLVGMILGLLMVVAVVVTLSLILAIEVGAQTPDAPHVPPPTQRVNLGGPRFGVTYLNERTRAYLSEEADIEVSSIITQFGWQFEKQFIVSGDGPSAVSEWVLLVGGLDQGAFLPSVSWLVGLRTRGGAEIGVGPNVTPAGAALVMAGGFTTRRGGLNIPLNVAVVPSKRGARFSILTGFSMR